MQRDDNEHRFLVGSERDLRLLVEQLRALDGVRERTYLVRSTYLDDFSGTLAASVHSGVERSLRVRSYAANVVAGFGDFGVLELKEHAGARRRKVRLSGTRAEMTAIVEASGRGRRELAAAGLVELLAGTRFIPTCSVVFRRERWSFDDCTVNVDDAVELFQPPLWPLSARDLRASIQPAGRLDTRIVEVKHEGGGSRALDLVSARLDPMRATKFAWAMRTLQRRQGALLGAA
jgi:hypothetical protein